MSVHRMSSAPRARVFFLSGAYHGPWCWTRHVTPLLSKLRYECIPIEYPRKFIPDSPATFNDYVNYSIDQIQEKYNQDTSKPNVIVAHSLGGLIGTNVAEKVIKDKGIDIQGFIHIASSALLSGENIIDNVVENELFDTDKFTESVQEIIDDKGNKWTKLKPECAEKIFYHDCLEKDIELAKENLVAEIDLTTDFKAEWSKDGYGRVNKLYIECVDDEILPIELQREMWGKLGLKREKYEVISMDTSHSPFLSAPLSLTAHIDEWMVTKTRPKMY